MSKRKWILVIICAVQGLGLCLGTSLGLEHDASADEGIELHTLKSHSRLVFHIDDNVTTEWKSDGRGFKLLLKGLNLTDLGAPLGNESEVNQWASHYRGMSDPRIAGFDMKEVAGGVEISGQWKFPSGTLALADPKMESFDYHQKTPPSLVIDFWLKKGPTVAEVAAARKQAERTAAIQKADQEAKKRAERHLASEKAKAESDDLSRFCKEPLSDSKDFFLNFFPAHEPVDFSRWISKTTPDSQFSYFVPSGTTPDAKYVRLALNLYRDGKNALVLRTLDFFDSETPQSEFRHEMRFLRANAMIKLGMVDQAQQILSRLMIETKGSPAALQSGMFLAARLMEKKSYLAALESFLWLVANHPDHRLVWVFHLGAAEALYALKQTDRAAKEYQWVSENSPDSKSQSEGALRLGDLYLMRFQYEAALGSYFEGLNHFPAEAKNFPAVNLNRAEALYWLGQYDRAREAFEDFVKNYSSYPEGWRATYRLGEILGREAYGKHEDASSRTWFYETINRYPFSAGATLARMRLAPCGDHGGFDMAAGEAFYSGEAMKFDRPWEVLTARYLEYRDISHIRMLTAMGHEDQAVDVGVALVKKSNEEGVRKVMAPLLGALLRKSTLRLLDEGKKYEALAFYRSRVGSVPIEQSPADPDYLLKLSQAASDLGLGRMGESLAKDYDRVQAQHHHQNEQGRAIAEAGTGPDMDERLAMSERKFAEAKGLWISGEEDSKIRAALEGVIEESPYSFEKELILGLMDERAGKTAAALGHGLKAQLLAPANWQRSVRMMAWLAGLEAKGGDPKISIQMYQNAERILSHPETAKAPEQSLPGLPSVPALDQLLLAEGEVQEKDGQWGEAAATYSRAIEAGQGGNGAKFQYARALLRAGDLSARNKALETLRKIASATDPKNDDFWKKLAREALADEESREKARH